jgi:hypothetical protein
MSDSASRYSFASANIDEISRKFGISRWGSRHGIFSEIYISKMHIET